MLDKDEILQAAARLSPQWLAGFFDGEGSIYSSRTNRNPTTLSVALAQNDPIILSIIAMAYGGGCGPYKSGKCYQIRWNGRSALPFLESIKDFVIVKRKQVQFGIEMLKLFGEPGRENRARRCEIALAIASCNARRI